MDVISNSPFWRVQDGLVKTYPTLDKNLNCDVVIVGGGISGALIAHSLVKENLSVVLIDKYDIGSGSTSGSTALIQYETDLTMTDLAKKIGADNAARTYLACSDAVNTLEQLAKKISHRQFKKRKSIYLASTKKDAKKLEDECIARKSLNLDCNFVTKDEIEKDFPFSRPGAITTKQAAELDPYIFTHQLLQHSLKKGLKIFDRTEMKSFKSGQSGITVKTVDGKIIKAKHIVIAAGYEIVKYIPKKLVDLNSSYAIISKPIKNLETWKNKVLLWETARPYLYLRTTDDNRAIIGGLDEEFYNPAKRDQLIPKKRRDLENKFKKMFPKIHFETAYAWAGTFAETKDGLPYIGSLKKIPNCYFSCGYGGNGIVFSVIAAEIIAAAIKKREHPLKTLFGFERSTL